MGSGKGTVKPSARVALGKGGRVVGGEAQEKCLRGLT